MDVSIIVTAYNYGKFIDECLDSCLFQEGTSLEYEVIVIDDGSTDDTQNLLAIRCDQRLRKFKIENSGIEVASNLGFAEAKGNYVVRVDADDLLAKNFLAHMEPFLEQKYDFYYSDYLVVDGDSVLKEVMCLPDFDPKEVMKRGDFLATGTLYSAKLLNMYGAYSTQTINSGLENYELIIKFIMAGARGYHVAVPLFFYRRHGINMSDARKDSIIAYGQMLFEKNGLGTFSTNKFHPYKLTLSEGEI